MTCKDCIYYEKCLSRICHGMGTDDLTNEYITDIETRCKSFKNKAAFIELPCKVGDTVFMPWEWNETNGIACLEVTHIVIDGLHAYIKTDFYTDDEDYYNTYNGGIFHFDDFGKIVFVTRKEAAKALKENQKKEVEQ